MTMSRWDPFRELVTLRDAMDHLFDEGYARPGRAISSRVATRVLPIDLYETPEEVVLKAALPGAKPQDVDINVTGDTLTLKGRISTYAEGQEATKWNWLAQELWSGEFVRQVALPVAVQPDKADARFEDGILTITLPKAEAIKPRQIKIKSGETIATR